MTEIELNELPRGVRERFADIKDAQFDGHPLVMAARERLDEHQDRHADCVETTTVFRSRIDQLLQQQREARDQLKVIADSRRKIIAEALLAGDDLSTDLKARAKCAELEHRIEAIDLGMPVIRQHFDRAVEACRNAAISLQADEEHIRGVIDELKLEEAKRLAYE